MRPRVPLGSIVAKLLLVSAFSHMLVPERKFELSHGCINTAAIADISHRDYLIRASGNGSDSLNAEA